MSDKNMARKSSFRPKIVEILFWLLALATVFFINISPQALRRTDPAYMIVFFNALLVVTSINMLPKINSANVKLLFSVLVSAAVFLSVYLFLIGKSNILISYYLPVLIALAMAFIVMVKPVGSVTVFIALCTFLLGDAFWNINIDAGSKIILPTTFFNVYSLSIVALFGYYFYCRELTIRRTMAALNERLKTADSMKSEFVANASHELRTPLTSIKNACALLNKTDDKAQKAELIEIIDSNVDRQVRLINNLLDLAKIEKGAVLLQRKPVNLVLAATQAVDSMKPQAAAKKINLELQIINNIPPVFASMDHMLEVYTNLIDNAIKYTAEGGFVKVIISSDTGRIRSIISDTGIGIDKDDIGKLFNRFKRLEVVIEGRGKGAGLGLAIVKEIIDSHGGKVWIESQYGVGTNVIFTLPFGLRKADKKNE